MNKKYLVKIYHSNKDIQTEWFDDLLTALKKIGKVEEDICTRVNWLNYTDLFFLNTKDFIRVNNLK